MFNLFSKKNTVAVQGVVNGSKINKEFRNKSRALDFIDNLLVMNNLTVNDVITRTTSEEYYCNDNSRFIVYSI